jgi:dTDP-4-amino-4,6-dideoxygalactose transaminase
MVEDEVLVKLGDLIKNSRFIGGEELELFEHEFAEYAENSFAAGCANGTDALVVALMALNVGHGDLVLTVPNTFIATAEAISLRGADIDFIDVEEDSFTMDPEKLQSYLDGPDGSRVKAVIPVHLYGQMADMEKIMSVVKGRNIHVIEDSAQAHGAKLNDNTPGNFGNIATYSFFPGKNLGAFGDAGAIVTNDEALFEKCKRIINHGRIKEKYTHEIIGSNSRLDTIQAAILRIKLRYLKKFTAQRMEISHKYNKGLSGMNQIDIPVVRDGAVHVYHLYVVKIPNRDMAIEELSKNGIAAGIHYPVPVHLQPAYKHLGKKEGSYPVTETLSKKIMSLPLWPQMSDDQIQIITTALMDICGGRS